MTADEHRIIQEKLIDKILELSKKDFEDIPMEIENIFNFFKNEIYINGFRHSYAEFFYVVLTLDKDDYEGSVETLLGNLQLIEEAAYSRTDKDFQELKKNIIKLCDHLALEIYRYLSDSTRQTIEKLSDRMLVGERKITLATQQAKEATKSAEETTKKLKNMQGETVAILSIFAAIVLAVSGGLSYLSGAISAVATSPVPKLILTVLACGFVLFNTVFILLYVVSRMLDKSIFLNCNDEQCENCQNNCQDSKNSSKKKKKPPKFIWFRKVRNCLPYIYGLDVIIILMIAAVLLFMFFQRTPWCPIWLK